MGIGSVIAGGLGFLGSRNSSRAAERGTEAQVEASREATQLQREIYNQNRQDMAPFRQNAINATNLYNALLGIPQINQQSQQQQPRAGFGGQFSTRGGYITPPFNPDGGMVRYMEKNIGHQGSPYDPNNFNSRDMEFRQLLTNNPNQNTFRPAGSNQLSAQPQAQTTEQLQQNAINAFRNLPGYKENLNQQLQAVDRSAAARGNSLSGRALLESQSRASNYADNSFNNYLNRIGTSAGQAVPIAQQMGQYGQNFANAAGNNLMNAGQARASGYAQAANAQNGFLNGLSGLAGYYFGG